MNICSCSSRKEHVVKRTCSMIQRRHPTGVEYISNKTVTEKLSSNQSINGNNRKSIYLGELEVESLF